METTLKRVALVILAVIFATEVAIFGNVAFASRDAYATNTVVEGSVMLDVTDIAYTPEAEPETVPEAIPETEPEIAPDPEPATPEETTAETTPEWTAEETDWPDYDTSAFYSDYDYSDEQLGDGDGNWLSGEEFKSAGRYNDGKSSYTWYSENVLPGGGLDIPGRHVNDEGYVVDGDGNICLASKNLPYGTVVEGIPFGDGTGVVYDYCPIPGNLDVYVSW